jgi:hypothetical protein
MIPKEGEVCLFQSLDLCKFLFSIVQLIRALGKRGSTFPAETINLQPISAGYRCHHLYIQSLAEMGNQSYWVYVTYGFSLMRSQGLPSCALIIRKKYWCGLREKNKEGCQNESSLI